MEAFKIKSTGSVNGTSIYSNGDRARSPIHRGRLFKPDSLREFLIENRLVNHEGRPNKRALAALMGVHRNTVKTWLSDKGTMMHFRDYAYLNNLLDHLWSPEYMWDELAYNPEAKVPASVCEEIQEKYGAEAKKKAYDADKPGPVER